MNKKTEKRLQKIIIYNRRARYDYSINESLEAGIALKGWEVKSIRNNKVQIQDSYITLKKGEAFLFNAHITPLSNACLYLENEPKRTRKLLLHKKQISKIAKWIQNISCTAIPTDLHWEGKNIKVTVSLAKGKKFYDKRNAIKARDIYIESKRLSH